MLGWDDVVRFGLEHGADDPCWSAPAMEAVRPDHAITLIAGLSEREFGPVRTVHDVAAAMLRVPAEPHKMNDAVQYVIDDGFVTPRDLFRAIFG